MRTAYFKLLNRKLHSNQIEGVVRDVLQMVGVAAPRLPKRSLAEQMRREMGALADVAAGVALAKVQNCTGASDDTTKLQEKQATNNIHYREGDAIRTINIGIGSHSKGTAVAKVEGYKADLVRVKQAGHT